MELTDLPKILDEMISKQKEKRAKTFVARYKNKNLIMRSGKSSWKAVNHAKAAVIQHFHREECRYSDSPINGKEMTYGELYDGKFSWEIREERRKQFRNELFKLIDIVELTD